MNTDEIQFGFMPECGNTNAIFILDIHRRNPYLKNDWVHKDNACFRETRLRIVTG